MPLCLFRTRKADNRLYLTITLFSLFETSGKVAQIWDSSQLIVSVKNGRRSFARYYWDPKGVLRNLMLTDTSQAWDKPHNGMVGCDHTALSLKDIRGLMIRWRIGLTIQYLCFLTVGLFPGMNILPTTCMHVQKLHNVHIMWTVTVTCHCQLLQFCTINTSIAIKQPKFGKTRWMPIRKCLNRTSTT